jgi:putative ATPase
VADIRREIAAARERRINTNRKTILFVDEIHRFNRAQQDSLLPDVESGVVRLIGATTFNPSFYVVNALMSRSLSFQLEPLDKDAIRKLLTNALADERGFGRLQVVMDEDALDFLAEVCEGDGRRSLNALEMAVLSTPMSADGSIHVTLAEASESVQKKVVNYDDDAHYDTTSAFIKSMRGSDPDAAIYYLAKMLEAGEDIRFIARRMVILASEDIGNADPRAITLAVSVMQAVDFVGMPEARIILAEAVCVVCNSRKSNSAYLAINSAIDDVRNMDVGQVPMHIRNAPIEAMRKDGYNVGYKYPHDYPGGIVEQQYLPDEIKDKKYFIPKDWEVM